MRDRPTVVLSGIYHATHVYSRIRMGPFVTAKHNEATTTAFWSFILGESYLPAWPFLSLFLISSGVLPRPFSARECS